MRQEKKRSKLPALIGGCFVIACAAAVSFFTLTPAVASHDVDSATLGIGDVTNTASESDSASIGYLSDTSSTAEIAQTASRTITVSDPDPVIVINGYDPNNENTVAAALELGTADPLPTAPHIYPDENDGWSVGTVSGYSTASCYDKHGKAGYNVTASGVILTNESVTVAVPESQAYLLGRAVAIRYGETIIVATVTDTGGFEKYGRALDLAPGCWKLFGAASEQDWGLRTVYYKFL